ncbi:adrenodoxin-like protein 2, mitochondrial isoform X2 [Biomphalaria glabrata]|uniref:Adrenodoxin-like protein 2, mitochondrial isoform X2 n=1 Tax=Biomphalaria glabrata TaxID=6526 RepID=A0A2C9K4I2_BIOGL|nr:adrenodoxin-like protein 2, mitochondrial isoform X2 [Biomphalaria glabrata]
MNSQRLLSILVSRTLTQRTPAPSIQSWSRLRATSVVQEKRFCSSVPKPQKQFVTIVFIDRDGDRIVTKGCVGDTLLNVAINNDVELEGACEGTLACSTCHLIFKPEDFNKLPDKPTDEELDMLDLAFGLTETSRLGCQVIVTKDMDGLEITVPKGVSDARK